MRWALPASASRARSSSTSPSRGAAASISSAACVGELESALQLGWIDRQLAQRGLVGAHLADRRRDGAAQRVVAAERVEHVALPRGRQQPLLLVLAVDLDQRPDHLRRAARR